MSNNTKRLSFFAKIAQRSTALQSLLEEATGKSAVGGIAPDGAGRQDYPTPPDPYTTQRYEKDIEVAQAQPTHPVVVTITLAGNPTTLGRDEDADGTDVTISGTVIPHIYAWGIGEMCFGHNKEGLTTEDSFPYYKEKNEGTWGDWEPFPEGVSVSVSAVQFGPAISCNMSASLTGVIGALADFSGSSYKWEAQFSGSTADLYTTSDTPNADDKIYSDSSLENEVGTVIAYSNITSDAVSPSNDPSAESINPNLESRIKHVKEFYRGESPWFMDSVGIKRYPNHYHVAWTVPSAADGTLSATANGYPLFNGEAVIEGATIVLTATPASGKQVGQWSGLPQGATTVGNTATFTLAAEVNASVTFAEAAANWPTGDSGIPSGWTFHEV